MLTNIETVMVTGAAGYIGSQTCKQLTQAGVRVIAVDRMLPRSQQYMHKFLHTNLSSTLLTDALLEYQVQHVIHTAATSLVGPSIQIPAAYYNNNVQQLNALLDACRIANVQRIVYSSSAAIYGDQTCTVLDETALPNPCNPYGRTKLYGEWILQDYAKAYNMQAVALRYFNVCGADPEGEMGQTGELTHLIAVALDRALRGSHITINGDDYGTQDGTCERDYVHVVDVAHANIQGLTADIDTFQAINIASGTGTSNLQIVRAVAQCSGLDLAFNFGARRLGDPAKLVADITQAQRLLTWEPRHSSLENIIRTAHHWQAQQL